MRKMKDFFGFFIPANQLRGKRVRKNGREDELSSPFIAKQKTLSPSFIDMEGLS